jgi:hypothetical protein
MARMRGPGSQARSRRSWCGASTARRTSRSCRRACARPPPSTRYAAAVEVLLPALRDLRRREANEEHGRRRPRPRRKLHVHLVREAVALAQVARGAGGDDVLPRGVAALRAGNHVVEGEAPGRGAAVDTAPAVTGEQGAARDLSLHHARNPDIVDEPDDVWPLIRVSGRAKWSVQLLDHLCLALEDEDVGAAERAHIERLVTRIENENLLHSAGNVPDYSEVEASRTGT